MAETSSSVPGHSASSSAPSSWASDSAASRCSAEPSVETRIRPRPSSRQMCSSSSPGRRTAPSASTAPSSTGWSGRSARKSVKVSTARVCLRPPAALSAPAHVTSCRAVPSPWSRPHGEDADMTRIPLDPSRTPLYRLAEWYARRTYGVTPDPLPAMAHNMPVLLTDLRFETSLARWKRLDPTLKALAVMASAVSIGCSWCVDFGYWVSTNGGIDPVKLREVPRWRDSDVYTDLERQVMAYAEAVTATPPAVTDEMVAGLRRELDDAALVELTMMVAVENVRSRFNSSLGLTSQGFKDRCEIPA